MGSRAATNKELQTREIFVPKEESRPYEIKGAVRSVSHQKYIRHIRRLVLQGRQTKLYTATACLYRQAGTLESTDEEIQGLNDISTDVYAAALTVNSLYTSI
jgi:hypothetical protein